MSYSVYFFLWLLAWCLQSFNTVVTTSHVICYTSGSYQVLSVIIYHHCNLVTIIGQPVSMKASDDSSSSLQVPESRNRVPTYHMRELARGKFLLNIDDITLLDCIGEGSSISLSSSELSHGIHIIFSNNALCVCIFLLRREIMSVEGNRSQIPPCPIQFYRLLVTCRPWPPGKWP